MAETILFDIAATLLRNMASLDMQGTSLAWGVESDLEKLKSNLSSIQAGLKDAEDKRVRNRQLDDWLLKLKDFMYDVEDLLDVFQYEALQIRVLKSVGTSRKVRNFFSSSNPLVFRHEMGSKMKALRQRSDDIKIEMPKFHYLPVRGDVSDVVHRREMTESFVHHSEDVVHRREMTESVVHHSEVLGRDIEKKCLIEHLFHEGDGETVSIIPIVGMGGVGKTTLAKLVYNDEVVQSHFDLKMWVCISDEFEITKLVKDIIKAASGVNVGDYTMERAQTCLAATLRAKKFLLILDDVWNEDLEKWVELKDLLLDGATGSKIIVTTRSPLVASIMGSVPAFNLKSLSYEDCLSLFVKCAFKEGREKHPDLMEMVNEIVKKCKGVPLAVRIVGSLLYLKTDVRDWIAIRDNEIWQLEQHESILPVLRLSYEQLPSHLKLCFSFCSLFPKDHDFNNVELVLFWMALGLIRPSDEDIGNQYIIELWSRSLFQDVSVNGILISFKMHDLVHDFAQLITRDEMSTISIPTQSIFKTVRHVAFWDPVSYEEVPSFLLNQTTLRTFQFRCADRSVISNSFVETCISRFKYMKALVLGRTNFEVLPHSIGGLKLLRLLDLSKNVSIKILPKSICQLQNLQALCLEGCSQLEELPKNIGKYLINLVYLSITTKQMLLEIGCLPTSLRFLRICDCENLKSLGERKQLECLTVLRTLFIDNCKSLEHLPRGLSCSTTIQNMSLLGCSEIDMLELESKDLRLRHLAIGGLPKLKDLSQYIQGSADSLQFLSIRDCSELLTLPASLKDLQKLLIFKCPKLSLLPEGMNHLTELEIEDCPELTNRCRLGGEDWTKIAHVPKIVLDKKNHQIT